MTLFYIILATLAGGVLSVLTAALLALPLINRLAPRMVAFSIGVLLAASFLDLLPEASEQLAPATLGATVLVGLLCFFLLEKLALWRHDHSHQGNDSGPSPTGMMIVIGDGVHNFVDGILIAAAFLQDPALGVATATAVIAHEIPQEVGDFIVLLNAGYSRTRALWLNVLSSLTSVLGGIIGYFALQGSSEIVPYALAIAAASFIYIAVADLLPTLQAQRRLLDTGLQVILMIAGVSAVVLNHAHH